MRRWHIRVYQHEIVVIVSTFAAKINRSALLHVGDPESEALAEEIQCLVHLGTCITDMLNAFWLRALAPFAPLVEPVDVPWRICRRRRGLDRKLLKNLEPHGQAKIRAKM